MTNVFCDDKDESDGCENPEQWDYTARVPNILRSTDLPLPRPSRPEASEQSLLPSHDAAYWARQTKGFDFSEEDKLDSALFNQILWKGLMGDQPYPTDRSGQDLRQGREELLKRFAEKNSQRKP
jgi:hypothetical protein